MNAKKGLFIHYIINDISRGEPGIYKINNVEDPNFMKIYPLVYIALICVKFEIKTFSREFFEQELVKYPKNTIIIY